TVLLKIRRGTCGGDLRLNSVFILFSVLAASLVATPLVTIKAQQPAMTKSAISGSVVRVRGGEPIAGARVTVIRVTPPGASLPPPSPPPSLPPSPAPLPPGN